MNLTTARHTALARLSDGERHYMMDDSPGVISQLYNAGYIHPKWPAATLQEAMWTITPKGLAALKGAEAVRDAHAEATS